MNELTKNNETKSLIDLIHHSHEGGALAVPFARDIFLFDTYVAGTMYNDDIEESAGTLEPGSKLDFFREPENTHDDLAIVIRTVQGKKIGYVPRRDNTVFARLMDAGKELFGRVKEINSLNNYIRINIEIYLHDD